MTRQVLLIYNYILIILYLFLCINKQKLEQ